LGIFFAFSKITKESVEKPIAPYDFFPIEQKEAYEIVKEFVHVGGIETWIIFL
jgi:hypothetical protein